MITLNNRIKAEIDIVLLMLEVYKKNVSWFNKDHLVRFERIISNLSYELKQEGFYCGLKVVGTDENSSTNDHVFSRKAVSNYLQKRHLEKEWTKAELMEELPKLLTSIQTTSGINSKLQAISRKNSYKLEDYKKMKHYKALDLSLEPSNKIGNLELITDDMKELMGSNQKEEENPFYKFILDE